MTYSGSIIVLAFPDTFVKMSDEFMCKVLPLVGLGTRTHIKAGHAALVLIENKTGKAQYFDFGRYITPPGKGRVRGANTDVELAIPIKAKFDQDKLVNLEEFLLWLDAHPEKTHGSGRLVASLCEAIDYKKALQYILQLQSQGSIPYKAFGKIGSNCARFVTETILASTDDASIRKYLKRNKKFTPSTVGNVEKSASTDSVFQVYDGRISAYTSSALKENLTNYFDKKVPLNTKEEKVKHQIPENAQILSGTGSSAWFMLDAISATEGVVRRFTEMGVQDFEGKCTLPDSFDITQAFTFVYDSHCKFCTIEQMGVRFRLELDEQEFSNLARTSHSA